MNTLPFAIESDLDVRLDPFAGDVVRLSNATTAYRHSRTPSAADGRTTPRFAVGSEASNSGRLQILEPVRRGTEHEYRDVELWNVLLEREIAVDRDKDVEVSDGQSQKLSVRDSPTSPPVVPS